MNINDKSTAISMIIQEAEFKILNQTGLSIKLMMQVGYDDINTLSLNVVESLIKECCCLWGIDTSYLIEPKRTQDRVTMRGIVCFIIRNKYPSISLKKIAKSIGGKDHTTVMYAIDTVKDLMSAKDPYLYLYFNPVKHLLK